MKDITTNTNKILRINEDISLKKWYSTKPENPKEMKLHIHMTYQNSLNMK